MKLPELPYAMGKREKQITNFYGLNFSENTVEGEMADTRGLTTENYPVLSQRGSWKEYKRKTPGADTFHEPTDIFEWDGKFVAVDGGTLYYDDEAIDSVTDGRKQFAVVGTKLCIFPDKTYIDLTNGKYGYLDAEAVTDSTPGNVTLTANSLTAALFPKVKSSLTTPTYTMGKNAGVQTMYSYGDDIEALRSLWDGTQWNIEELEQEKGIQGAWYDFAALKVGEIFIPEVSGQSYRNPANGLYAAESGEHVAPERADFTYPYYAVVTSIEGYVAVDNSALKYYYDVYSVETKNALFSGKFTVGDKVNISNVPYGFYLGKEDDKQKIAALNDETNTITFEREIFQDTSNIVCSAVTTKEQLNSEYITLRFDETEEETSYYTGYLNKNIPAGALAIIRKLDGSRYMQIIDEDGNQLINVKVGSMSYSDWRSYISGETNKTYTGEPGLGCLSLSISMQRQVPDMDYICESGNRLWGVSNAQENRVWNEESGKYDVFTSRCIYVSALGFPERFWDFDGVSTDSYQVAIGSEGDFTAICAFNGGVCCWKEQRLYRITGNYPAEYYMHDYQVAGVQKGSYRSLIIENEVLYYKGVLGIYAYTGGTPALISSNLGAEILHNAAGGTDGKYYYVGCSDSEGGEILLSYDLIRNLWLKEAEIRPDAFVRLGDTLYMLANGKIFYLTDDMSGIEWLAEFVPFTETEHTRKGHTKLRLRLDMDAGSTLKIEVKEDRMEWRTVREQETTDACTLNIPIRLGRCDRYSVRLSGTGGVIIRSMIREYTAGSEI